MLPKTSTYVKSYDRPSKWMYFLIEDDDSLEKYNTIWDKVSTDIKKEFDSKPVDSNHTCLAAISLDSALKKDENYYLQEFLKECKCIEKKVIRHINDHLSDFSSSDEE